MQDWNSVPRHKRCRPPVQPPYMYRARDERKKDMNPPTGKVQSRGTFDGYKVAAWRRSDHPSWKVKAWLPGCPRDWFGYAVTAGMFELKLFAHAQREAVCTGLAHGKPNWRILRSGMPPGPLAEPGQYLRLSDLNAPKWRSSQRTRRS
jgi:hypothetical protein